MKDNSGVPIFKLRLEVRSFTPSMQTVVGTGALLSVRHLIPPTTGAMTTLIIAAMVLFSLALAVVSRRIRVPWLPTALAASVGAFRFVDAGSAIDAGVLLILVFGTLLMMYGVQRPQTAASEQS